MSDLDGDELARRLAELVPGTSMLAGDAPAAADVRARLDVLIDLLVARGALTEGHRRLLAKAGAGAAAGETKRVRLRVFVDKYALPDTGIDCDARLHLCHGRCCALAVELSRQDIEEKKLRWTIEEPYVLPRGADARCTYQDGATGGCAAYEHRPAACRIYDCRQDQRVWIDFDQRIPAPLPPGLPPLRKV
jgi:Fe-S-cluster containining protein